MSHSRPLQVVILAAGQGTRMRSGLPKVLHPIAGQAMVRHVIAAAAALNSQKTVAVVGHGAAVVESALADTGVQFVLQSPQLGTGHAVQMALPALQSLPADGQVLILYGDVPLIQPATLRALLQAAGDGVGLVTQHLDNPTGYGRIVRDGTGKVLCNVEEKDATDEQRKITEINTGILCLPAKHIAGWLGALSNQNAQGGAVLGADRRAAGARPPRLDAARRAAAVAVGAVAVVALLGALDGRVAAAREPADDLPARRLARDEVVAVISNVLHCVALALVKLPVGDEVGALAVDAAGGLVGGDALADLVLGARDLLLVLVLMVGGF